MATTPPQPPATGQPPGTEQPPDRVLDATSLLGLAHPLRVRILDELVTRGPATSAELARRLGESTGATSYHLRQLARHGFIEEDPGRGSGRERWWRDTPTRTRLPKELTTSPATRETARLVLDEWQRARVERYQRAQAGMLSWDAPWQDTIRDLTSHLRLTAAELGELGDELLAVLERWEDGVRGRPDDGTLADVEVRVTAFPIDPPPSTTRE